MRERDQLVGRSQVGFKPVKVDLGPAPALDDKVREMIEERVRRKKTSEQYERWIESKRKRAMIDIKA